MSVMQAVRWVLLIAFANSTALLLVAAALTVADRRAQARALREDGDR